MVDSEVTARVVGFVVDVPLEVPEAVCHEPAADGLLRRFEAALKVAGLTSSVDEEGDREDWVEGAVRVTSCLGAAAPRGVPVYAVGRGGGPDVTLVALNQPALDADPRSLDLVLWGLVSPSVGARLARDGHRVADPFGASPPYATNPGFLANAGRSFVPCRSDDEDQPEGVAHLPSITAVLRERVGRPVAHKVVGGALKEYAVRRFVPTAQELMPEDVAWSVVHRSGDVHSVQDDVPMSHEYRLFVVDGRVVTGAGSVMEHTPLDRLPGTGTFDPRTRRRIRGKGAPETPDVVAAYAGRAQGIVDAMVAQPGFPRHLVVDLFEDEAGEVGVVEANPLRGSGFFANDADAVADAAVGFVLSPGFVHAETLVRGGTDRALVLSKGAEGAVRDLWEAFHDGDGAPPTP